MKYDRKGSPIQRSILGTQELFIQQKTRVDVKKKIKGEVSMMFLKALHRKKLEQKFGYLKAQTMVKKEEEEEKKK